MKIILKDNTELPISSIQYLYDYNSTEPGYFIYFDYSKIDIITEYVTYLKSVMTPENTSTIKLVLEDGETHTLKFKDAGFVSVDKHFGKLVIFIKMIA